MSLMSPLKTPGGGLTFDTGAASVAFGVQLNGSGPAPHERKVSERAKGRARMAGASSSAQVRESNLRKRGYALRRVACASWVSSGEKKQSFFVYSSNENANRYEAAARWLQSVR